MATFAPKGKKEKIKSPPLPPGPILLGQPPMP